MLKLLKPNRRQSAIPALDPTHADLFMERYTRLRVWALQLTGDRNQAEDILHDAYIQFTVGLPDISTIRNLDNYLCTMLRNINVSQLRRKICSPVRELSIVDYDSIGMGLSAVDPSSKIQTQEHLQIICKYACSRRETSKAGSILILRFFHGYYPREIAQILGTTRFAVNVRLQVIRDEVKSHLANIETSNGSRNSAAAQSSCVANGITDENLIGELRGAIFESSAGECISHSELRETYKSGKAASLDLKTMAHIVSCPRCLDEVNKILGLPLLAERNPADSLGSDKKSKDGPDGTPGGTGGKEDMPVRCKRRAKDLYEHHPQELFISVNGYEILSQKLSSDLEESLTVNLPETISFIEIFSEQGMRLLLLNIEPTPDGGVTQSTTVHLSDGRTLVATANFSNHWPTLKVVYRDPELKHEQIAESLALAESSQETSIAASLPVDSRNSDPALTRLRNWFAHSWGGWLRPATVAVVAILLIVAMPFLLNHPNQALQGGAKLLDRAATAERDLFAEPGQVVHRVITLEERKTSTGEVVSRRKIDSWQTASEMVKARRVFNETDELVAGEWLKEDGSRMVYQTGQRRPQVRLTHGLQEPTLSSDLIWQLTPSVKEFSTLVGGSANDLTVEERPAVYVVHYRRQGNARGLVNASLTLRRTDLRAVEQTVVVNDESEPHEYHFVETGFEQQAAAKIPQNVFQLPLIALIPANKAREVAPEPIYVPATPELEVEVLQRLDSVQGLMGEQLTLSHTKEGALSLQGVVETDERKSEITRALGSLTRNPALKVRVDTTAEAQKQAAPTSGHLLHMDGVEVAVRRIPIDADLRTYLGRRGVSGDKLEDEIQKLSVAVTAESMRARLHASALKELTARFSASELKSMNSDARTQWSAMVKNHAQAFLASTRELRGTLAPIFQVTAGSKADEITRDADLGQIAEKLSRLASSNDDAIGQSFRNSSETLVVAPLKNSQFWRSLALTEELADRIVNSSQLVNSNQ